MTTEPKVEMRQVMFGDSLKAFLTALAADLRDESNMIVIPLGRPLAAEIATTNAGQTVLVVTFDAAAGEVSNDN